MCLDKFTLEASGIYLCLNYVEENNKKVLKNILSFTLYAISGPAYNRAPACKQSLNDCNSLFML